jgi:hypothetical protein
MIGGPAWIEVLLHCEGTKEVLVPMGGWQTGSYYASRIKTLRVGLVWGSG